jgi:hypothetical protein
MLIGDSGIKVTFFAFPAERIVEGKRRMQNDKWGKGKGEAERKEHGKDAFFIMGTWKMAGQ